MATIESREGKYRVQIRRKNIQKYATFSDKETAVIWANYHEDLIDNMDAFEIPPEKLINLSQAIDFKVEQLIERGADHRTIEDLKNLKIHFKDIMDCPLSELTTSFIRQKINEMKKSIVRRGGYKATNKGDMRIISDNTIHNRLRYLSTVLSYMIEKGANIQNVVQPIVSQFRAEKPNKNTEE